jgi:hypothetical protein
VAAVSRVPPEEEIAALAEAAFEPAGEPEPEDLAALMEQEPAAA